MPINEVAYDYENIKVDTGNGDEIGARSISYEVTVDTEKQFGAGREALDATEGVVNVEDVKVNFTEAAFRNLIERMGDGFMSKAKRIAISASYAHDGNPLITDTFEKCRIIGISKDHQQGPEGLETEVTFQVMTCKLNGLSPVAQT